MRERVAKATKEVFMLATTLREEGKRQEIEEREGAKAQRLMRERGTELNACFDRGLGSSVDARLGAKDRVWCLSSQRQP